jgi:hypothetical protein
MRICRLNRIKIKNPEKWDRTKNEDFIEDCFVESSENMMSNSQMSGDMDNLANINESITLLTINEEVTIFEYAPRKF